MQCFISGGGSRCVTFSQASTYECSDLQCWYNHECSALQLPFCFHFLPRTVCCLFRIRLQWPLYQTSRSLGSDSFSSSHTEVSLCSLWKLFCFVLFWNAGEFISEWVYGASLDLNCDPVAWTWVCCFQQDSNVLLCLPCDGPDSIHKQGWLNSLYQEAKVQLVFWFSMKMVLFYRMV